jgi:drug/metabolite transporter (DMT)-like permease
VSAGITAGLVWGLAFLIPVFLQGWNPVVVTAGRYLAYGAVSVVLFVAAGSGLRRIALEHWRTAVVLAVTGNVGYYWLLVLGIQTIGAPATDVVIGCIPVALTLVGNWISPAYPWRRLALPITLVTVGLAIVNTLELAGSNAYNLAPVGAKAAGLLAAFGAVVLWTWYGLANARFLAEHQGVTPATWSTVVGVATGAVTVAVLPLAKAANQLVEPTTTSPSVVRLIIAAIILGVVVSWAGTWLWNAASSRLAPALAGLLINVETVSGFAYVYAARHQWPPTGQLLGLALVIVGVVLAPSPLPHGFTVARNTKLHPDLY